MKDAIFTPTEDPMITTGEDVDRETLENEEREEREDSPQGQDRWNTKQNGEGL
jgi:hypothetical protein